MPDQRDDPAIAAWLERCAMRWADLQARLREQLLQEEGLGR